jgi:hypothetical protein
VRTARRGIATGESCDPNCAIDSADHRFMKARFAHSPVVGRRRRGDRMEIE